MLMVRKFDNVCCSCVLNFDILRGEGEGFEGEILVIFYIIE